ncbi:MAG: hypothetical protein AAFO69_01725, partial [Bacteroidota bacterium]
MKSKLLRVNIKYISFFLAFLSFSVSQAFAENPTSSFDVSNPSIFYSTGVDLPSASGNFDIAISTAAFENAPQGLALSPDGTKLFLIGSQSRTIYEYDLSTPFLLSSAVSGNSLDVGNEAIQPTGMSVSMDGLRIYITDNQTDRVFQYDMSIAFDISTATYSGFSLDISPQDVTPTDLFIAPDNATLFVVGSGTDAVYKYTMGAGDLSSATYSGESLDISATIPSPFGIYFNGDGSRLFITDSSPAFGYTYFLSTPYDLTTAELSVATFNATESDPILNGIALSSDGTQVFIADQNNDQISSFKLTSNAFFESGKDDGTLVGEMIVYLCGDTFTNPGATLTIGTDYTIDNLPSGLTPVLNVASDGRSAFLELTGTAIEHDDADDVDNLIISFENSAFVGGDASAINNAVAANTNLRIDFTADIPSIVTMSVPGTVATAAASSTFDVSSRDATPQDITFSNDGSKMFMAGNTEDFIVQYDLSTNFDVATAVQTDRVDINNEENDITGVTFNATGSRMYFVGLSSDMVWEMILEEPFVVSSGYFSGKVLDVSVEDIQPSGIQWNADGSSLFMLGLANDQVHRYNLSTPYDLSTASYSGDLFAITEGELSPNGFDFNVDGSKMFVMGAGTDRVLVYDLSTGFDITTAVISTDTYDVLAIENSATGIHISPDGTKMFIVGVTNDTVLSFDLNDTAFIESAANQGDVVGALILSVNGDTFTNPGATLTPNLDFTSNFPTGLVPVLTVSSNGRFATLTVSGQAALHDDTDLSSIELTFLNSAFAGGDASVIANATLVTSNFGIDFLEDENNQLVNYSTGVDISTGSFSSNIDLTGIETTVQGLALSGDGTKLFVLGSGSDNVYEYNLSTPFDVSTATSGLVLDVSEESTNPTGIAFSSDGFEMYLVDNVADLVLQYTLSSAYDLSTAFYSGVSLDISTELLTVSDIFLAPDDQTFFLVGTSNDQVVEYEMSFAGDLGSAVPTGAILDVTLTIQSPNGIFFNNDGSRLFVTGSTRDRAYTYFLSTPYDLTTAELGRNTLNFVNEDTSPQGIAISTDGTRLFMAGDTNDDIFSYDLTNNAFFENADNTGAVVGEMIISIVGDSFNNVGSTLVEGTDYFIDNVPAGLLPVLSVASDGQSAFLTLGGTAENHDDVDDLDNIIVTFTNSAFLSGDAASVLNSTSASTNLRIDFTTDLTKEVIMSTEARITTASATGILDVTSLETNLSGVTLSPDGSKMYVVGNSNDHIIEYNLSTNFDVTTATSATQLDIVFEENSISDITINPSGSRLYFVGTTSDRVWEVVLDQPFELSSAFISGATLDIAEEEVSPTGLRWSADGFRLFVIGSTTDRIFRYDATTPFDLSSATYSGVSIPVSDVETAPNAIEFNVDGTKMFVLGQSSDMIHTFNLATAFDISTAVNAGVSISLASFDTTPTGLFINREGTKMVVAGSTNDDVFGFDLTTNAFIEGGANRGGVEGQMIVSLEGDTFANPESTLNEGVDYTVTLSAGLVPELLVASDGRSATLSFSGQADDHDDINDITNIQFSFQNTAFAGGDAAIITNAAAANSNLGVDFVIDEPVAIDYSTEILISAANQVVSIDVSARDGSMTAITFNNDGTKMYTAGQSNDAIFEFDLSIAFDISTALFSDQLGIGFEEGTVQSIAFNPSGSRLYMLGSGSDALHEYILETPFALASASYKGAVLDLSVEDTSPSGFSISPDGTRFYMVGQTTDFVYQYSLTDPFDFSTATYTGINFGVSTQESSPTFIFMNQSGTQMFIGGTLSDRIFTYDLATPFVVNTVVNTGVTFSVAADELNPHEIFIDPSGTRMFMVGVSNDSVVSY